MIIAGDFDVVPDERSNKGSLRTRYPHSPTMTSASTTSHLADAIHREAPETPIVAQVSAHVPGKGVSPIPSLFSGRTAEPLSSDEIKASAEFLATAIERVRDDGFSGAQLHGARGGLFCRFLSPFSNTRQDTCGVLRSGGPASPPRSSRRRGLTWATSLS